MTKPDYQNQCAVCPICIDQINPDEQWVYLSNVEDSIIIHALHFGRVVNTREAYLALQKTPELWSPPPDFICKHCGGIIMCGCDHNESVHCAECNREIKE